MRLFRDATTDAFCDEEFQDTITISPEDSYPGFCNSYAHSSHKWAALGQLRTQQVGVTEDINEWMIGSQTDIKRKHLLFKKLKKRALIKPDIALTSPEISLIIPAFQEPTKNTYLTSEVDTSLKRFINILEADDKKNLLEALVDIKHLTFVEKLEFEELENPTLIIRLSEMNIETEEKIYQIEYDLLKSFKNNIDFIVLPA